MEITSTGIVCDGEPVGAGFVMGNPGEPLTLLTDTNCDGENDALVTIDTGSAGWAMFDEDGNYIGDVGYPEAEARLQGARVHDRPRVGRPLVVQRHVHAVVQQGQRRRAVNSDTDFADAGRTEAFDNPWVNFGGGGYLPNDRRHQIKLRGAYALGDSWEVGASLAAALGPADQRVRQRQSVRRNGVRQLLHLQRRNRASTSCTSAAPKAGRRGCSISART